MKDGIEALKQDLAQNYIASKWVEGKEDAESKKQAEAATHGMKSCQEKIVWMEALLKEESKKK